MQKESKKFSWRARAKSFVYAFAGLKALVAGEHNARIHLAATVAVIVAGILFRISPTEWAIIMVCIGAVIGAEAFNSAVEAVCDKVSAEYAPLIKRAKDMAAAAVLVMALASVAVACFIFIPKL